VVDVESRSILASRMFNQAALLLLDFASAFPSISRDFIWDALSAIGIPGYIIAAIKALYSSNIHLMNVCGAVIFAFCAGSGVRQGCPLSSTIFVMCTDCVMRLINSSVGIHGTVRAYADDVAIIVHNLWGMIFSLFDAFKLIGEACLLKLNAKKCILIPLWKAHYRNVSCLLRELVPAWKYFSVLGCGKYLGFFVGPESNEKDWEKVAPRFMDTVKYIHDLGLPRFAQVSMYNMLAVSKTSYIGQLRPPSAKILELEKYAVALLGFSVWNVAPDDLFFRLKDLKLFPVQFRSIAATAKAATLRASVRNTGDWKANLLELVDERGREDKTPHLANLLANGTLPLRLLILNAAIKSIQKRG